MCSTAGHLFVEQALLGSIPKFTSLENDDNQRKDRHDDQRKNRLIPITSVNWGTGNSQGGRCWYSDESKPLAGLNSPQDWEELKCRVR